MTKLVMQVASEWRKKPTIVIAICVAWCALLVISIRLGIEDYTTSVLGYQALPTRKTDQLIAYMVGAMPMLIQVAFGFWAIEKNHRLSAMITLVAFIIDVSTDVYYKASENTLTMYILAAAESILLFTIGTEFLFLISLENIAEYLPSAIAGLFVIFGKIGAIFSASISWLSGDSSETDSRPVRRRDYEERDGYR